MKYEDEHYMELAIAAAKEAEHMGEVPIGAVIVMDGEVISTAHNMRETDQNAVAHAELLAIQEACQKTGSWRLDQAELFVTLEPCPMCSGAIILSRLKRVVYGASDPKAGCAGTLMNLPEDDRFNHQSEVKAGVLEKDCGHLLTEFFRKLRAKKKKLTAERHELDIDFPAEK